MSLLSPDNATMQNCRRIFKRINHLLNMKPRKSRSLFIRFSGPKI